MKEYNIIEHEYDVVVLGAGGSGFFLFYVPKFNKNFFNKKFKNFIKVPFKFEKKGTRIIFNDKIN